MKIITAKRILFLCVISALTFAFINSLHKNRLEVFFDAPADNFFEIFYQSAKDPEKLISDRHFYPKGENVRVLFSLRRTDLDELRLDPFDGASSMALKRVVISSFFYSSTISGEDLFKRLKTVQMLDAPRMQGGHIVLSGNSYDPISVVDLRGIDRTFDYKNLVLWMALSFLAFVLCLKASAERRVSNRKTFQILLISLVPTLLVVGVFYPGFMTYDTLHALRAARSSVTDAIWPPMVSYIWRPIDWLSTDPATMLFIQVWLFFFSLMLILHLLTQRLVFSICIVGLFFCVPVLLGTIGAVWKDVLMAALLLAGMVLAFQIRKAGSVRGATGYFLLSMIVLLLAAGSRHNAITAVVPMLLYASWALVDKLKFSSGLRRIAFAGALGVITVVSVYSGKIFFDKYSFPEFNALQGTGSFKPLVRGMDLFAASLCLNKNLLEAHSPRLTLDDIKKGFDPRHSNYSAEVFKKVDRLGSEDFDEIWWKTMREHPVCFLSNKFLLIKYVLGANSDDQFLLMTPVVNASEFGYFLPSSGFRDRLVQYASQVSDMYFLRPWVFFVLSFPAMVLLAFRSPWRLEYFVIFSSSMLYALGFFIFGNATDARLLFYSNALNFVFVCMAIEFCFREFFLRRTAGRVGSAIRST